uniref:Uncharacterized protein n=1 Tax=Chromera velia CCMP2878 TaxID=1169474 RepID=A0A0G4GLA7_9ALVE|eukprot:Cvel_676.t1-p1 / transcript=Cvel_676.t1 / gene=Cvel_676 / organism=Chromera_velia_CCMP2878 / gene_product=hypothetical protein / transcript_product=hypothetical protein / location=Cvel_scaffold21:13034-15629(+) / protein_length=705 / sequence_SO=supercontig / SO=protein_coding / is_pseudo=false
MDMTASDPEVKNVEAHGDAMLDDKGRKIEMERQEKRVEGLLALLKHWGPTAESLAKFAKQRDFFGVVWLSVFLFKKSREMGKVSIDPPCSLNLSGICGLSPEKLFLILHYLPSFYEEIKVDSLAMKGRALPLFIHFLERVQEGVGSKRAQLKSVVFAENAIGPLEAPSVFLLLLPFLESLCLKGNALGNEGFGSLLGLVLDGRGRGLKSLDLQRCGLKVSGLEQLCSMLERGELSSLETLDLEGNECVHRLDILGRVLKGGGTPCLRHLNLLSDTAGENSAHSKRLTGFFKALRPPVEDVKLHLGKGLGEEVLRGLGAGQYDAVRFLHLNWTGRDLRSFLTGVAALAETPKFEALELNVSLCVGVQLQNSIESLKLLVEVIEKGRFCSCRKMRLYLETAGPPLSDSQAEALEEATLSFCRAVAVMKLHRLSHLHLCRFLRENFDNHVISLLGGGVRVGNLRGLRVPDLNFLFVDVSVLLDAIGESEEGLPVLEELNLCRVPIKSEGVKFLTGALLSGKLTALSVLCIVQWYSFGERVEFIRALTEAVRLGMFSNLVTLHISDSSQHVPRNPWTEFIKALTESEVGYPRLKSLQMDVSIQWASALMLAVLTSGRFKSLESLCTCNSEFDLDQNNFQVLCEALRSRTFPPNLWGLRFRTSVQNINLNPLIRTIAESENGLPPCVTALNLAQGNLGGEALDLLASSGQ